MHTWRSVAYKSSQRPPDFKLQTNFNVVTGGQCQFWWNIPAIIEMEIFLTGSSLPSGCTACNVTGSNKFTANLCFVFLSPACPEVPVISGSRQPVSGGGGWDPGPVHERAIKIAGDPCQVYKTNMAELIPVGWLLGQSPVHCELDRWHYEGCVTT